MTDDEDLADHVEQLVIMWNRANAAAQLAEDVLSLTNPIRWRGVASKMMDRDLAVDDEFWRDVLTKRDRRLGREPTRRLPSPATRIIAGHMMAMAATAREMLEPKDDILADTPEDKRAERDANPPPDGWTIDTAVVRVGQLSGGQCEAHGHHEKGCPGQATPQNERFFSFHHIFTREEAKRFKVPAELVDRPSNLILVWNGHTSLGAGGCHGKIHRERTTSRALGLLAPKGAKAP